MDRLDKNNCGNVVELAPYRQRQQPGWLERCEQAVAFAESRCDQARIKGSEEVVRDAEDAVQRAWVELAEAWRAFGPDTPLAQLRVWSFLHDIRAELVILQRTVARFRSALGAIVIPFPADRRRAKTLAAQRRSMSRRAPLSGPVREV